MTTFLETASHDTEIKMMKAKTKKGTKHLENPIYV